ncbi:uncharacterized protein [Watersipora subatra]|uniref:uncharacterized protein isoform X2 n=1 Tax=Watersipora subatra TaxID=2589382 RepID=UPI00355B8C1E
MQQGQNGWTGESEDESSREEIEEQLYCQIYHDRAGCLESECVVKLSLSSVSSANPLKERLTRRELCSKNENAYQGFTGTSVALYDVDSSEDQGEDDSDIQVVKEIVKVQRYSDEEPSTSSLPSSKKTLDQQSYEAASEDDTEFPEWAKLNAGVHNTDNNLHVHFRTNHRQRHDSLLSLTGSALGEEDNPLVSLRDDEFDSLEKILDKLPDEGWEIINTDLNLSNLGKKGSFRYHKLKCKNCDERGHLSSTCPIPKKEKRCSLCSEVHRKAMEKRRCPYTICTWCAQAGHFTNHCRDAATFRASVCQRCKQRGHKAKACHELWRQWRYTTHLPECKQGSRGYTNRSLPSRILHFNTFGAETDFGRCWAKLRGKKKYAGVETQQAASQQNANTMAADAGLFSLPIYSQKPNHQTTEASGPFRRAKRCSQELNRKGKRKAVVIDGDMVMERSALETSIKTKEISTKTKEEIVPKKNRKQRKLDRLIAKKDGPKVKQPQTLKRNHVASTGPSHAQHEEFKSKKLKLNLVPTNLVTDPDYSTKKVIKVKKINEQKKKRKLKAGMDWAGQTKKQCPSFDSQELMLFLGSKPIKSWNDAF